jgi:hypothetical protein
VNEKDLALGVARPAPRFAQSDPGGELLRASRSLQPPSAPVNRTIGDLSSWPGLGRDQVDSGCSLAAEQYGMSWRPQTAETNR